MRRRGRTGGNEASVRREVGGGGRRDGRNGRMERDGGRDRRSEKERERGRESHSLELSRRLCRCAWQSFAPGLSLT